MSARILLVEDEPGLVLTLSDLLTAEGYTVESAGAGSTGLALALNGGFDLIVLDVMLPARTASKYAANCGRTVRTSPSSCSPRSPS